MKSNHQHTPHSGACDQAHEIATGRLKLATIIIIAFFVLEVVGGLLSHSLALLADAGHMATDAIALLLALSARWIALRPARDHMNYGYHRVQVLAAFINALALLGLVVWLIFEALNRLGGIEPIDAPLMLGVAIIGLAANGAAFFLLHNQEKRDVNMRGALLHVISDLLGSVAAIIAGTVILFTGWLPIDPLLTFVVCGLISISAIRLLRETTHVLLEGAPDDMKPDTVRVVVMEAVPAVRRIKRLNTWMLTPQHPQLIMHVEVEPDADHNAVLADISTVLRMRFGEIDKTIQIEPAHLIDKKSTVKVVDPWPTRA